MAMVFTLSTFAREWLREKASVDAPPDELELAAARARAEEAEEARREAERAAGTPVTPETFNAWWERFSAEQRAAGGAVVEVEKSKRPTGRRFFETRGEAALGGSEDEAEGEPPAEEGEEGASDGSSDDDEEDEEDEEDDDDEWDPDAVGCACCPAQRARACALPLRGSRWLITRARCVQELGRGRRGVAAAPGGTQGAVSAAGRLRAAGRAV
jgi:hypothetical protein